MTSQSIPPSALLGELEEVLRSMPSRATIQHEIAENEEWFGRAGALMAIYGQGPTWDLHYQMMVGSNSAQGSVQHLRQLKTMLQQARYKIRLEIGPLNTAFNEGHAFDYFDELRKQIETADDDILFIDPYLDAEFVSRYMPHVKSGVSVRLLTTGTKIATLRPALEIFVSQSGASVEARLSEGLHDRYVIIDNRTCFQSGSSFKDGAKRAMTTLTQITDVFSEVRSAYEGKWASAQSI